MKRGWGEKRITVYSDNFLNLLHERETWNMSVASAKRTIQDLLGQAGIQINGSKSWDIQVHNPKFYPRILSGGSLALGESYMDGWWDCEALDEFITRVLRADLESQVRISSVLKWNILRARLFNPQVKEKAFDIGKRHYDLGNELFQSFLDRRMTYSCGYWKHAATLDDAQDAKLDLICRKLNIGRGRTVMDIGCGWGSFARFAAEKYGAKVTGITVSNEQVILAREYCKGLDVELDLSDYRDLGNESFERVVSIGMFEHVGYKNYATFFKIVHSILKGNGLLLLHTIGSNLPVTSTDPWIEKYIFPHSMLPSASQITRAYEGLFRLEDWHNFGPDYDKTLMCWYENFNRNWENIEDQYDERFRRMWNFYLLSSAASFRTRKNQLWQIVFSKVNSENLYESVR
jgi:cyclopropane-fatty-acyl-phospholipid synthase